MARTLPITVRKSAHGTLVFVGEEGTLGTYVLRIRVRKPLNVVFGKFGEGQAFHVRAGEYTYVGSALNGLVRRVVDHASRTGDRPPQRIFTLIRSEFPLRGLSKGEIKPKTGKTFFYNVDHLLDRPEAELHAVYLVRSPVRLEEFVAELIQDDPAAVVFARGLGAADFSRGATHLLKIKADKSWWDDLPARLARVVLTEKLRRVGGPLCSEVVNNRRRLSEKQIVTLVNMWHERRTDLLRRMINSATFNTAEKESRVIYDTHGWQEVISRLARGRGSVLKLAADVSASGRLTFPDADTRRRVAELAAALQEGTRCLRGVVARVRVGRTMADIQRRNRRVPPGDRPQTLNAQIGQLVKCVYYLQKNARDVPHIRRKTRGLPTRAQLETLEAELTKIDAGAGRLLKICDKVAGEPLP